MGNKAYTLKFGKDSYFYATYSTKKFAQEQQKARGGKVIGLTKSQYKKIYGDHDWGFD